MIGRVLADALLTILSRETAGKLLDEAEVRRINLAADAAERLKWPDEP